MKDEITVIGHVFIFGDLAENQNWDFWGFESLWRSLSTEALPVFILTCWWSSHLWLISGGNKYFLLKNMLKIHTQLEVITTKFWNFGSQIDGPVAFYPAKK